MLCYERSYVVWASRLVLDLFYWAPYSKYLRISNGDINNTNNIN